MDMMFGVSWYRERYASVSLSQLMVTSCRNHDIAKSKIISYTPRRRRIRIRSIRCPDRVERERLLHDSDFALQTVEYLIYECIDLTDIATSDDSAASFPSTEDFACDHEPSSLAWLTSSNVSCIKESY